MSTLRRIARKVVVPGTPPVPAELPWVEYIADPTMAALPATRVKSIFPWAATRAGDSMPSMPSTAISTTTKTTGGGSTSELGGYYTTTSYNGVEGTYVVTVRPDGSKQVVRV